MPAKTQITITPDVPNALPAEADNAFWGEDGLSFKDALDIVNPLQQLPLVSTVYRAISGESISSGSRLIGGILLGGPIGFLAALANEIFQSATGKDIGETMIAAVTGEENEMQLAQNTPNAYQRRSYELYEKVEGMMV